MGMQESIEIYKLYWKQFEQYLEDSELKVGRIRRAGCPSIIEIRAGVDIVAIVSKQKKKNCVELLLEKTGRSDINKAIFLLLEEDKKAIENEIGLKLKWENCLEKARSKILIYSDEINEDFEDKTDWNRQHAWLKKTVEAFDCVFTPRLEKNKIP